METLLKTAIILFSIGSFFSNAIGNIGFFSIFGFSVLELLRTKAIQEEFKNFHKEKKLWIPILFLVILAYVRLDFSNKESFEISFSVACKYVRFLSVLFIIPVFFYYKKLTKILIHSFGLSCFFYYFHYYLTQHSNICIIHTSVFIALCCIYYTLKIFFVPQRKIFCSTIQCFFFFLAMFCINQEKTGAVALAVAVAIAIAVTKKRLFRTLIMVSIAFSTIFISIQNECPLMNRINAYIFSSDSVSYRIKMLKECFILSKKSDNMGVSTGSYRKALLDHRFNYLDDKAVSTKYPHPHNEWVLWMVQWGVFGLLAFILLFGYTTFYFIKNFSRKYWSNTLTNFYSFFGILINVIFIISGGCESIFFRTIPQSVYLLGLCMCVANIESNKRPHKRKQRTT